MLVSQVLGDSIDFGKMSLAMRADEVDDHRIIIGMMVVDVCRYFVIALEQQGRVFMSAIMSFRR